MILFPRPLHHLNPFLFPIFTDLPNIFLFTYSYTFRILLLLHSYGYKVAVTVSAFIVFRHFYTRHQDDSYCFLYSESRQTAQHVIVEIIQIHMYVYIYMAGSANWNNPLRVI